MLQQSKAYLKLLQKREKELEILKKKLEKVSNEITREILVSTTEYIIVRISRINIGPAKARLLDCDVAFLSRRS